MGSQQFTTYNRGMSAKEAYNNAVEDATEEYGHQEGYSGQINSSGGFRDITDEFKKSKKSLNVFIDEQLDKLTKFDGARCIAVEEPIVNNNKIKTQVDHIVEKGTKKWVLKYSVQSNYKGSIGSYNTKGEAVKNARKYTEETGNPSYVVMMKELERGTTTVAKISYKQASNEKKGKWIFFGWASC